MTRQRRSRRTSLAPAATAAALALALGAMAACSYTKEDDTTDTTPLLDPTASSVPTEATGAPDGVTTTTLAEADLGAVAIELQEIVSVDEPTALAGRAGDPAIYIAEQAGTVRRVEITTRTNGAQTFTLERTPVLDLSDEVVAGGEQGLLGITFSTDGNRIYAAYTGLDERQYLVEFGMSGEAVSTSTRRDLLAIEDPFANHNGGMLAFGPDGFLYWAMGDGGSGGDPTGTGQDPTDLLGSILRIDPDVAPEDRDTIPYAIPVGNPFAGGGGAPEVWAYGLRNPWRFSFDRFTGDLWIGDVGQDEVEEIDLLLADGGSGAGRGVNLGWPEMEGDRPYQDGTPPDDAVAPIFAYDRSGGGCSVTGGYVYRGTRVPTLAGVYLFADYCEGRLRGIVQRDGELLDEGDLGIEVTAPTSFGQDADGELYVLSQEGTVFRIVTATT